MPSPSRSNFTSPIHAASSLSHWMTVRFSMRACSIGTTSPTGRSVSTMPPEWMPRCRGAFSSSVAYCSTRSGMSCISAAASASGSGPQCSTCFDQASCCPGECPSAFAMSRTAFFGRYWMTLATCAARSRP